MAQPPRPDALWPEPTQPLWFALILPALPLQLAHQALDPTLIQRLPIVITHGTAQRPLVCFSNTAAQAQGVRPGLRLAQAQALCATLIVLPREPQREHQAAQQLSAWAYGFSAQVLALPALCGTGTGFVSPTRGVTSTSGGAWVSASGGSSSPLSGDLSSSASSSASGSPSGPSSRSSSTSAGASDKHPVHPPVSASSQGLLAHDTADAPCGLLIETGGSARLFGGQQRLHRHIEQQLNALGLQAVCAHAPTPRAAWLLAAARAQGVPVHDVPRAADLTHLHAALAPLPLRLIAALDSFPATSLSGVIDTLAALGLRTVADLLKLPHEAVHRRFGPALLRTLLKATGAWPDPQPAYVPPARFEAQLDLPADLTESAQLMLPAQRLLSLLEGFLRGRNAGATLLAFSVGHSPRRAVPRPDTRIALTLAAPERDAIRLAKLLAEQLNRVVLPEPATRLTLTVEQPQPFAPVHASLLPPAPEAVTAQDRDAGWLQLAESLHARFGSDRVYQLRVVEDHRPEHAYAVMPLAVAMSDRPRTTGSTNALPATELAPPLPPRPLLLLASPLLLSVTASDREARPAMALPLPLPAHAHATAAAQQTASAARPPQALMATAAPHFFPPPVTAHEAAAPRASPPSAAPNAAAAPHAMSPSATAHDAAALHAVSAPAATHRAATTHGPAAPQPQPVLRLHGQPLTLLIGPERIESGWWELDAPGRRTVFRDYFVARTAKGQTVWVFQELQAPRRWFLHGYFA